MDTSPSLQGPRRVLLFSGHMIDAPDRKTPRFPPGQEPAARDAIAALLSRIEAGPSDTAISSGACGGDLLFAEAVLSIGMRLEMYLPFEPAVFATKSVDFAGADWHRRFEAACALSRIHVLPGSTLSKNADPYEQTNLHMLDAARSLGAEQVHFICLWNGQGGDGPGGTAHLAQAVRRMDGQAHWLDTNRLWR